MAKKKSLIRLLAWVLCAVMVFSSSVFAADGSQAAEPEEIVAEETTEAAETDAQIEDGVLPGEDTAAEDPAADPTEGEDPAADPAEGEDPAADPAEGEDPAADPAEGEDPAADPAEGEDPAADPAEGEDPAADPAEGEDPAADPAEGDDPAADPAEGDDPAADPAEGDDPAPAEEEYNKITAFELKAINGGSNILGVQGVTEYQLDYSVEYDGNAYEQNEPYYFTSSDEAVLQVDPNGYVRAVGAGEATISLGTKDNPNWIDMNVTVADTVYRVTLDLQGAVLTNSDHEYMTSEGIFVAAGKTCSLPVDELSYDVEGYSFKGWELEKGSNNFIADPAKYKPTKDVTIYAKWSNKWLIRFDLVNGTPRSGYESNFTPKYVSVDSSLYLPSSYYIEREGYEFLGWAEVKGGTVLDGNYYYPDKDITLYARWKKMYAVTLNPNSGKWNSGYESYGDKKYVRQGEETYLPGENALSRSGYIFEGWTTVKNGTDIIEGYSYYTPSKDTTLYAKWAKAYTVKFNLNGGKKGSSSYYTEPKTVKVGDSTYLSTGDYVATKDGYALIGWTEVKNGTDVLTYSYTPTKNITLYAKWEKAYKITLNLNGGKWNSGYEHYGTDGVKWWWSRGYLSVPGESAAANGSKALAGWSTTKTGKPVDTYYFTTTKNMTLYAVWKPKYTIKFNLNGGSWANNGKDYYGSGVTWYQGKYLDTPDNYVTKAGYSLMGWSLTKGGEAINEQTFSTTKNLTLYAVWKKNYTVTFNANGGTWNSSYEKKETIPSGSHVYLYSSSVATKKNSILIGWSDKKTGGTLYKRHYKVTKNVTLYAQWAKAYTVTLNANGGTVYDENTNKVMVQAGESMSLYGNYAVSRSGYKLAGWTVKKNTGTVLSGQYKPTKSITLYAKWAKNVTLTLKAGKGVFGDGKSTQKVTVGSGLAIGDSLPMPTLENKIFLGWYADSKYTKPVKRASKYTKATTLYAKWQSKPLKITVNNLKGAYFYSYTGNAYVDRSKNATYSFYIDKGARIGNFYAYKGGYSGRFYLDSAFKKPVYSSYVPTADTNLYIKWNEAVNIIWDGNGGGEYNTSENDFELRKTGVTSAEKSLMVESLPGVTQMRRNGYVFVGWYLASDSKKTVLPASHVFTKDAKVKAKWAAGVKITIKLNGGVSYDYEKARVVPNFYAKKGKRIGDYVNYIPTPTKKGYVFNGWKSSVTNKIVKNIYDVKPTKATTFTAQWKKASTTTVKTVTVTIKSGAGSIWDPYTEKYVTSLKVKVPKNTTLNAADLYQYAPEHDERGKHLIVRGWSKVKQNGTALAGTYKFTKAVTIYPIWKAYYPTVALVTNGGSYMKRAQNTPIVYSVAKNGKITLPTKAEMEREGYKFAGWYSDAKLTKKLSNQKTYKVTKSGVYLFAKWTKK